MSDRRYSSRHNSHTGGVAERAVKVLVVIATMAVGYIVGMYVIGPAFLNRSTSDVTPQPADQSDRPPITSIAVPSGQDTSNAPIATVSPRVHRTGFAGASHRAHRDSIAKPAINPAGIGDQSVPEQDKADVSGSDNNPAGIDTSGTGTYSSAPIDGSTSNVGDSGAASNDTIIKKPHRPKAIAPGDTSDSAPTPGQ